MAIDSAEISDQLQQLGENDGALTAWLDSFVLLDGQRALTNLELIDEQLQDRALLAEIFLQATASADPDNALNMLERLFGVVDSATLKTILRSAELRSYLLTVLGGSPFLAGILCRHPDYCVQLFLERQIENELAEAQMLEQLRRQIAEDADFEQLQAGLRHYKAAQILRIGSRDLCGLASLEQVMEELSSLAAACLQRAYEICGLQLQQEYGLPLQAEDEGDSATPAEMTILGMGKLGGYELNFSSDIDLIFCYTSSNGETAGGRRHEKIGLHRYFVKLAELITRALHQVTADGFVFRVDTRLRPDGNSGDLAISLVAAETYYESWGQSWERAALIKARPVAGSIPLGMELLQRLKPFVFRRYLDFGMIEDIKLMKQKINASLERKQEGERNLKLGRGGIREIEFFIQAQQLVNAGRRPHLQHRNSLKMLALLADEELISSTDRQSLSAAYRFLRLVEHRIQVVQEQQTHALPRDERGLQTLARRSGFFRMREFHNELEQHRQAVAQVFHDLFHSEEDEEPSTRPEINFIFDAESDPDRVKDLLEENGFNNPEAAYNSLLMLRGGDPFKRLSQQGVRCLERLAPLLMGELIDSPNPDQALANLERFLRSIRARSSFFSLLVENPAIAKLLISLFASSQMLSRIFIQRPELMDTLVSRSYAVEVKDRQQMSVELIEQVAVGEDFEQKLDNLRRYHNEELLRIALRDLQDQLPQGAAAQQLSWLAEACLEEACRMARRELAVRFGGPDPATCGVTGTDPGFVIVGMGKLGGEELNYHSDLDIIFIYACEGATVAVAETDPKRFRSLSHHEYYAKLAQRIISVLTLVTREGDVYKIDTRLRPSGNQGPLVTSLEAFRRYHQERAHPWERQAMTRARVVCGPQDFAEQVQQRISELTFERPLPQQLQAEMYRLRGRMEHEIARETAKLFNIKTGRGGMVDVEFISQYLQLCHGRTHPGLRIQNTVNLLECLRDEGLLVAEDAELLLSGYKFLRRLENKLRLFHDQSINELPTAGGKLRRIARSLGFGSSGVQPDYEFREQYKLVTEGIRGLLDKYLKPETVSDGEG
jgi:glutamate-ammonia-ligase adenylyltransferase